MPWCNDCNRFYTQSTLNPDGTCPDGHLAAPPPGAGASGLNTATDTADPDPDPSEEDPGPVAPWHFWVMVVALAIYLGWRLVQGVMWAIGKL